MKRLVLFALFGLSMVVAARAARADIIDRRFVIHDSGADLKIGPLPCTSHTGSRTRAADVLLDVAVDGEPATFDSVGGSVGQVTWSTIILRRPW